MAPELTFHHIGLACRDLDAEAKPFELLGYRPEASDFTDPRQGIRGRFLIGPGLRLELLVPLPGSTVLDPWLGKEIKMYHQAFESPSLEASIEHLRASRGKVVVPPTPAVAFDGRLISFVLLRNLTLIELIQAPCQAP